MCVCVSVYVFMHAHVNSVCVYTGDKVLVLLLTLLQNTFSIAT